MLFLLTLLGLLVYRGIFNGFFFMDDFYFLSISQAHSLAEFIKLLIPIRFTPYRPVSQQLFFFTFDKIFGLNPLPYHIFIMIIHIINSYLVYKICSQIIKQKSTCRIISLMYVVSPIHFIGLFSITGSYVIFGLFYTWLSIWLWLKFESAHKPRFYLFSLASFILAVFSAEISAGLILVIFLISKLKKKIILLLPFGLLILINLIINKFWAGAPQNDAFSFQLKSLPQTFRWYLLRALGLPEGIKNGYWWEKLSLYLGLIFFIIVIIYSTIKNRKILYQKRISLLKYLLWIIVGAIPYYFMSNHLNPIYFSLSLVGFFLLISTIILEKYIKITLFIFIAMSIVGVNLLFHTHWTVNRSNLAKTWVTKIFAHPENDKENQLVIKVPNADFRDELMITLSNSRAGQLFLKRSTLSVEYELETK